MQQPTCTNVRIRSVADAHAVFYAVEQRYLPMVNRRLDGEERRAIRSGCVYVWEERGSDSEATGLGIERWTDGVRWGPSRVRDEFLFYHEKELDFDFEALGPQFANMVAPGSFYARKERLVKQTYSVYIDTPRGRRKWHLIAYFTQETVDALRTVDQIPSIAALRIPAGRFRSARAVKGRSGGARHPHDLVTTPSPPRRVQSPHRYAPYHTSPRLSPPPKPVLPPLWPAVKYDLACAAPSGNKFKDTEHGVSIPPLGFIENTHVPKRCPVDEWALRSFDIEGGLNFPQTAAYSSVAHTPTSY
ncbi:unnamed protein product [Peniophora sp. CBMAI 1063]|nr:unnamed protein product [Peniophora sp. CBMAI 1063]